ncbi:MAG TPA: hypothetical protein VI522_07895, partial [Gammaproteobacteria bacterium]|nr:hypothetical protein [Gammaproteobacteria bacterium]
MPDAITQASPNAKEPTSARYAAANDIAQLLSYLVRLIDSNEPMNLKQAIAGSGVQDSNEQKTAYACALIFYLLKKLAEEGQQLPKKASLALMLEKSLGKDENLIQIALGTYSVLLGKWNNDQAKTLALFESLKEEHLIVWFNQLNSQKTFSTQLDRTINSVQIVQGEITEHQAFKISRGASPHPENDNLPVFTSVAANYNKQNNTVDLTHIQIPKLKPQHHQDQTYAIQIKDDDVTVVKDNILNKQYRALMQYQTIKRSHQETQTTPFCIKTALSQPAIPRAPYSQLTYDWVKSEFDRYLHAHQNDLSTAFIAFRLALNKDKEYHHYHACDILIKLVYEKYKTQHQDDVIKSFTATVNDIMALSGKQDPYSKKDALFTGIDEAKYLLTCLPAVNKPECIEILFSAFLTRFNKVSDALLYTLACLNRTEQEQEVRQVIALAYQTILSKNLNKEGAAYKYVRDQLASVKKTHPSWEKEICYLIEGAYPCPAGTTPTMTNKFKTILGQLDARDTKMYIRNRASWAFKQINTVEEIIELTALFKDRTNYNDELLKMARMRIVELVKATHNSATQASNDVTAAAHSNKTLLHDLPQLMKHNIVSDHRGKKGMLLGLVNTDTQNEIAAVMRSNKPA